MFLLYSTSAVFAQNISGFYEEQAENEETCIISLQIEKKEEAYRYHLITAVKNQKGRARLKKDTEGKGVYIVLEGIKWSETSEEAALPKHGKTIGKEAAYDVDAFFTDEEMVIQNTGNSMNYFVKLGECDKKYIHLIKKEKNK